MDQDAQNIQNADAENRHDRPKDSLSLVCAVLMAQHNAIQHLISETGLLDKRVEKLEQRRPW